MTKHFNIFDLFPASREEDNNDPAKQNEVFDESKSPAKTMFAIYKAGLEVEAKINKLRRMRIDKNQRIEVTNHLPSADTLDDLPKEATLAPQENKVISSNLETTEGFFNATEFSLLKSKFKTLAAQRKRGFNVTQAQIDEWRKVMESRKRKIKAS